MASGSWSYNQDDQLSGETYDQDGNVTAANGKTFSYDSQKVRGLRHEVGRMRLVAA